MSTISNWFSVSACAAVLTHASPLAGRPPTRMEARHESASVAACKDFFATTQEVPVDLLAAFTGDSVLPGSADWLLSVAFVESAFMETATSRKGAQGLMQLMPVGSLAGQLECGIGPDASNVRIGSCLLRSYLREAEGSWFETLILFNSGYKGLTRWHLHGTLSTETTQYVLRVFAVHEACTNWKGFRNGN